MKTAPFILLFALTAATRLCAAQNESPQVQAIPFEQLGTEAQKKYQGDGISITPTADGARLRAVFQKLEGYATNEGLWLTSTADESTGTRGASASVQPLQDNRFRIVATGIGRGGAVSAPASVLPTTGAVRATSDLVTFTRPGLIEEYRVSMDGVRQDFIILERPTGEGGLDVQLGVTGAIAETAASGVKLTLANSGRVIAYSKLRVTDATGRELTATMQVPATDHITVQITDARAVYPVRIDPTFSDADWVSLAPSAVPGVNGSVSAIAVQGTDVYVGGSFSFTGTVAASNIAKWNGSTWSLLGTGTQNGVNGNVNAIAALSATEIYVGGTFTTVADSTGSSIAANRIAKWNGSTWSTLGTSTQNGAGATVNAIAILSATELYVGGAFTTVADSTGASISARRIAKWNTSTNRWSPLGTPTQNGATSTNATVSAIAVLSASEVYVGGTFTTLADSTTTSVSASNVAKWNGTTGTWSPLGTATQNGTTSASSSVLSIAALSSTEVYVGGIFSTVGDSTSTSISANNIAKWNGSSSTWSPLGTATQNGATTFNGVRAISAISSSEVYVGGDFQIVADSTTAGISASRVAKWNGTSNTWSRLGTASQNGVSSRAGNGVSVLAIFARSSTEVYVGGSFHQTSVADSTSANIVASRIAKWNGSAWGQMPAPGGGLNSTVYAIAVNGTDVYIGGDFTQIGSLVTNRIAKWNGSIWSPLGTSARNGMSSTVYTIAALSATEIYAGGFFTTVADSTSASIAANRIAKWNTSTNTWSRLGTAVQNGTSDIVSTIAIVSSTEVYVGGWFTTVSDATASGISANHIAKWNGTAWSPLGSPTQNGASSNVFGISAVSPTEIYIGGSFTSVADSTSATIPANRIAKWNGSTSTWSLLGTSTQNGMTSTNASVSVIAAASSTEIFMGGGFTTVADSTSASISASNIVKWNAATSTWSPLGSATQNGVSGSVTGLVALSATEVYAAGFFGSVADATTASKSANRIARWDGSVWTLMGGGVGAGGVGSFLASGVRAMAGDGAGHLFLGGDFVTAGTSPITPSLFFVQANIAPDLAVEQPVGTGIADGGTKNFGTATAGSPVTLVFTLKNTGSSNVTGLGITKDGPAAGDFTVTSNPTAPVLPGGSTTFTIQFAPTTPGAKTAAIHIANNAAGKNPYDINLTGTGLTAQEYWRQTWFGSTVNSGNGADTFDFDNDGLVNLVAYAFGQNPTLGSSNHLPSGQVSGGNFVITFTEPAGVSGLTYGAEWSATLLTTSWTPVTDTGTPPLHIFSVPIGANTRVFIRLKVTGP